MTDRTDFKPLQVLTPRHDYEDEGIVFAASCVADAFTVRRSVVIKKGREPGVFSVHERVEAPEADAGTLMSGSYDLSLAAALAEAARRLAREERYVKTAG